MPLSASEILATEGPVAGKVRETLGGAAYEARPEQIRMAEAVGRTLESRGRLLVEAGTGVGKSFAYLVPAILRCLRNGEKVVVATSTIALQEQLIGKDIPLLAQTLGQWAMAIGQSGDEKKDEPELLPVLAKGRGNYISIRRLMKASERQDGILPDAESRRSLHVIEDWARTTRDGSLSTLPVLDRPEVWDHVRSDSDNCMGRKCPTFSKCFYQAARRELEKANLIVCNHALFFADLALRTMHGRQAGASANAGHDESATGIKMPVPPSTSQVRAILPNYDHVIFDEAHGLEDAACEHFGLSLSMPRVLRLLRTLYSPRRRRGYLLEKSLRIGNAGIVDRALTLVQQAEHACVEFFEDLLAFWRQSPDGTGRMRRPGLVDDTLSPTMTELAVALRRIRDGLDDENERIELGALAKRASEIAMCCAAMVQQTLGEDAESGGSPYVYWVEVEGEQAQRRGPSQGGASGGQPGHARGSLAAGMDEEEGGSGPSHIGAAHNAGGRRRFGPRVSLACAPIEVAALLRRYLFDAGATVQEAVIEEGGDDDAPHSPPPLPHSSTAPPAHLNGHAHANANGTAKPATKPKPPKRIGIILTSATLATRAAKGESTGPIADRAFAHVMTNLGVRDAQTLQLGSPFDYRKQARLIVDLTVPDPKARPQNGNNPGPGFADVLAARVLHHLSATNAGAFVLFTSFATMHACADRLHTPLSARGWPMFVHGRDGARQALLRKFLEQENGVLLGAASFWQGVDVRGERLRNVIITRLPFEPPDRPLVQARCERIEMTGANPFMQDSLPRAIIRFKQGFGRLIRSKTDKGQVVVLDPRIVTARYGKMFIDALPAGIPIQMIRPEQTDPEEVFQEEF